MPACPRCNENIDSLKAWFSTQREYVLALNNDGAASYLEIIHGSKPDQVLDDFACPKCSVSLFGTEAAAISFLRGGE